jgi:predicted RNA-binding Zn-ribbon protein involved in translation (DUF1610 family)
VRNYIKRRLQERATKKIRRRQMEGLDDKVEFLCLGCGLQGLFKEQGPGGEVNLLCPKCGDRVITSHLLKKEQVGLLQV